jgi:hypothetical protein
VATVGLVTRSGSSSTRASRTTSPRLSPVASPSGLGGRRFLGRSSRTRRSGASAGALVPRLAHESVRSFACSRRIARVPRRARGPHRSARRAPPRLTLALALAPRLPHPKPFSDARDGFVVPAHDARDPTVGAVRVLLRFEFDVRTPRIIGRRRSFSPAAPLHLTTRSRVSPPCRSPPPRFHHTLPGPNVALRHYDAPSAPCSMIEASVFPARAGEVAIRARRDCDVAPFVGARGRMAE